ncbi:MAG: DegV family protein [Oscillospiraceae bacterium]|nr:DegV family protein [Oscillospiraceae bacterium]
MSKHVCITADSTCDLSAELVERFGIRILPLTISLGDETFLDDGHFTPLDMYKRYRLDGVLPKTSAPGMQEFIDFFAPMVEAGNEVVHLDISAELSNTANAARLAAEEFGGAVHTVDSRMLSTGVGLLAIEGAECRDRGMGAEEIAQHLRSLTGKVETSFVLDTLAYMSKGGRCSNFAALGANLLKLKPALEMKDGKLGVYKKYRGSIEQVYRQYIRERLSGKKVRPGHVFITDSGEIDPAVIHSLDELVRECIDVREIHHTMAGCTVATHCGPKTLGILFLDE